MADLNTPRRPDWPERLRAALAAAAARPFVWGAHDCALFAGGIVHALTGADPAARWRGRYATALGARRCAARAFGALSPLDVFAVEQWPDWAGLPRIEPAAAQRGDLVSAVHVLPGLGECRSLAVVAGAVALAPGLDGLEPLPRARWRAAWRVG